VAKDPAHVVEDLAHIDAAADERGARRVDVEDRQLQNLD
jgi:hypothetical protein